ncbi:MAG: hypothetical protein RLY21_1873 [Planctomycetota bacterium]
MNTTLTLSSIALCASAILLGQVSALAGGKNGGKGDGGVAGGSTDCASAPALIVGDNAFDTSASTVALSVPGATSCGAHTMYKVNYFTFTPTASGNHTFTTCGGASWDTRLLVMTTCSAASGVLGCNDDTCGLQSTVSAGLVAGTTYRVVVGGYGSSNAGPGTLNISIGGGGGGGGGGGSGIIGPDVIVGAIPDIMKYGSVVSGGQTIMAYAIGTTSCNIGDELLDWFAAPDNRHPFITQNIYRIKGGRIQQIGLGWGKHGFTALQGTLCGPCKPSSSGTWLGIGCSDPYNASLNGSQTGLGTRSEVNAATGYFPGTPNAGMPAAPATIGRRIQVNANDLNPSLNAGATYLVEGQYIHAGDAARGNDNNNASWRSATVGTLTSGSYTISLTGATVQQQPAIHAWRAADATVTLVNADVVDDGRFILGYKVSQNPNGSWHYEYAVQNLTSDRSGRSFEVPLPAGASVSNIGFSDVFYHSGDPYDGTDWAVTTSAGVIRWTGPTHSTSPNGNALRFSTIYNFWFDANVPPTAGNATLGLFKPGAAGSANSIAIAAQVPTVTTMPGDLNGDGLVNAADLSALLGNWGGSGIGDINGDGTVGAADLAALLGAWTS